MKLPGKILLVTAALVGLSNGRGFSRYIDKESRGKGGADAFFLEIGLEPGELQAAFREYVLELKAR